MPKFSPIVTLDRILDKLTKQWHEHRDALAKIEAVFSKYGIKAATAVPATGEPVAQKAVARKGKKRGKRGHFAQTGHEFILGLLSGGKSLAGAEVNAQWEMAGRGGRADQPLSVMVKAKKLKRMPNKDGRGSRYTAA
jgi:hypothetical protein